MALNLKPPAPKNERPADVPMELGTVEATAAFAMAKMTKTNKVMFSVKFADADGKVAWANIVAPNETSSPKHSKMFYGTMEKLGLTKTYLDDAESADEVAEALVGAKALVTVTDEEWSGKTYRKVTWIDEPAPFTGK